LIRGAHLCLKVRVPIGKLNYELTKRIGEVARDFGEDYIDITTRMQIVLRYIKIENIAKVINLLRRGRAFYISNRS